MAFSPVYQIHTKTLFSHAWQEKNPETKAFLDDQAKNTEDQKKTIDHRVGLWLKELEHSAALDADARDKLIANIKQVGQYAKDNKRFWAFAIYSQLTFPTSWAFLQSAINSPGKDNSSELARMAQQHAALLDALDPSGYFAKKYFEIYQTLHITFALPQLLTLSGAQVDYDLIIDYLKQFIESNEKNTGLHDQVLLLKELLLEEEKTHTLQKSLDALVVLAAAGSGMAPLGSIMQQFAEQVFPKFVTNPKFQGLAKVLSVVIVGGITALTVWNLCLAFKSWDKLSANQRAEVIFNAVRMGTELLTALVVRGVQIYAVFSTSGLTGWQRMAALGKAVFGIESEALNKAVGRLGSRLARWLGSTSTQGMAAAGGAEAAEEASLLAKFMGPNLTKFVASAFGAIFVIIGLYFSIRALTEGGDTTQVAMNSLMVASGALTLFAIIGGWAVTLAGIEVGAVAVAITTAEILAVICALAGLGFLIYELFIKKDPPNPFEEFLDHQAKEAGFALKSHGSAIDYAVAYNDKSQSGVSLQGSRLSVGSTCLTATSNSTLGSGAADNSPATVWLSQTNGEGLTRFSTNIDRKDGKMPILQYLSVFTNGEVRFADEVTDDKPNADIATQWWWATVNGDAEMGEGDNLKSLKLDLQPVYPDAKKKVSPSGAKGYLSLVGGSTPKLTDGDKTEWTLTMAGLAPGALTMSDIHLYVGSESVSFSPGLGYGGQPVTYKITSGTLPDFLSLNSDTGEIRVKTAPTAAYGPNEYTLTASNSLGHTETSFKVEVKKADAS
ncbi:Ig domain-containing protein [Streptomyces sp. NPDC087525]|uniref:Ig domain-containing protein n=1 Tax=Streptomyces sp. NPDC087525 TaxID=3365793 RepID=UPI003823F89E